MSWNIQNLKITFEGWHDNRVRHARTLTDAEENKKYI